MTGQFFPVTPTTQALAAVIPVPGVVPSWGRRKEP